MSYAWIIYKPLGMRLLRKIYIIYYANTLYITSQASTACAYASYHKWRLYTSFPVPDLRRITNGDYTPFPVPVWRPKQISTPFWIINLFSYGLIRITIALTNIINSINVVNTYYNWDFISGWIEEKSLLYPLLLTSS